MFFYKNKQNGHRLNYVEHQNTFISMFESLTRFYSLKFYTDFFFFTFDKAAILKTRGNQVITCS